MPGYESTRLMAGKGFAFISFNTLDNANAAKAALTGRSIRGMPMRINYGKDQGPSTGMMSAGMPQHMPAAAAAGAADARPVNPQLEPVRLSPSGYYMLLRVNLWVLFGC